MENSATSKRKASSQCPPTLSAGGWGGGGAETFVMLVKRKEDLHFLNFNCLLEVVLALRQLNPIHKKGP